jgi:hypothetical protein
MKGSSQPLEAAPATISFRRAFKNCIPRRCLRAISVIRFNMTLRRQTAGRGTLGLKKDQEGIGGGAHFGDSNI